MKLSYKTEDQLWGILLILPALIGVCLFVLVPLLGSFYISLTQWNLLSPPEFVGFDNYRELLQDKLFYKVLWNTFLFVVFSIFFSVVLPLILAVGLHQNIRLKQFFKTAYFLPFITPLMVIALVWQWMFDPHTGVINYFLSFLHIQPIPWLFDDRWAMVAIIIITIWKYLGYNMMFYLTGMSAIPESLYDSANIDGASVLSQFTRITLPLLTPTIFFVMIVTAMYTFQAFEIVYLMTGGGPNNSTLLFVYWLYKLAFEFFQVGKASAVAYLLFFIILVLTLVQWKLRKKWVLYE